MPLAPIRCGRVRHWGSMAGARPANRSAMNSCDLVKRLTLNALVSRIAARVADWRSRPASTSGGSREIDTRLLAVRPRNSSSRRALITTTPAGKRAITSRNGWLDTCPAQPSAHLGGSGRTVESSSKTGGDVAKWQGRGLQNLHPQFDSGRRLQTAYSVRRWLGPLAAAGLHRHVQSEQKDRERQAEHDPARADDHARQSQSTTVQRAARSFDPAPCHPAQRYGDCPEDHPRDALEHGAERR